MSISDAEIDDLAKKLQGFQVAGETRTRGTGRLGIYLDKPTAEGQRASLHPDRAQGKEGVGRHGHEQQTDRVQAHGRHEPAEESVRQGLTLILPFQPVRGSHAGLVSPREQAARRIPAVTEGWEPKAGLMKTWN